MGVSILPSQRTPWDVIGSDIGQALQGVLPGAVQQGYQRGQGLSALDQAQKDIQEANGDPYKIAMAFARAGAQNPNLERSLGPLAQTAMANAKVNRAFPNNNNQPSLSPQQQTQGIPQQGQPSNQGTPQDQGQTPNALPGPFNIFTGPDINQASEKYARDINDPSGYGARQAQLDNLNKIATEQRKNLEDAALQSNVKPEDLPKFMIAGKDFDTRNPSQWVEKTKQKFKEVKSNLDQLDRAFIPGLGNALLGQNRDNALKKLEGPIKNLVKQGYEDDVRTTLAENYMSPTEIEEAIRPLTPQKIKAIESLPKGSFPAHKTEAIDIFSMKPPLKYPIGSYAEAQITHPKELSKMQNDLVKFFKDNVDENTAILPLATKIWEDRDYDWQQFAPAINQAVQEGLKLNGRQETEMADISTQAPRQSLPDIFQSFDRVIQYFRGNK